MLPILRWSQFEVRYCHNPQTRNGQHFGPVKYIQFHIAKTIKTAIEITKIILDTLNWIYPTSIYWFLWSFHRMCWAPVSDAIWWSWRGMPYLYRMRSISENIPFQARNTDTFTDVNILAWCQSSVGYVAKVVILHARSVYSESRAVWHEFD